MMRRDKREESEAFKRRVGQTILAHCFVSLGIGAVCYVIVPSSAFVVLVLALAGAFFVPAFARATTPPSKRFTEKE